MGLYLIDPNCKSGVVVISTGERIPVQKGDRMDITVKAYGLPSGQQEYKNVEVVSIHDETTRGSIGCPGGRLRWSDGKAWHGASGNAVLSLKKL